MTYDGLEYEIRDDHVVIKQFKEDPVAIKPTLLLMKSKLNIPTEIDGIPVTEIADRAFACYKSIKSVSMPSVTGIGKAAFYGCTSLKGLQNLIRKWSSDND